MLFGISIVIATYNSQRVLTRVLKSIQKQDFPKEKLEIILVDGGSVDATVEIGRRFKAKILNNPRTEPVYGKHLGFLNAKFKFVMFLDHDEVLLKRNSLRRRLEILRSNPQVKAIAGGNYRSPKNSSVISEYINDFGDPFSFFIYRVSKKEGFFFNCMKSRFDTFSENKDFAIFDFSNSRELPITELVAGGAVIDATFIKENFPSLVRDWRLLPHVFYFLVSKNPRILVLKKDPIIHYSSTSLRDYLAKLRWRVKNNIFFGETLGVSGFIGREKYQPKSIGSRIKKYFFIPYSFLLLFPLIDSFKLIIERKDYRYLFHFFITLYCSILIVFYLVLKIFGYMPNIRSYDEKKVIDDK
jgi:glycosyltransferase involved in cell wall biosynthesis